MYGFKYFGWNNLFYFILNHSSHFNKYEVNHAKRLKNNGKNILNNLAFAKSILSDCTAGVFVCYLASANGEVKRKISMVSN